MSETNDVLEAALKLAPSERVRLLEQLSTSLDGLDLGEEWEAEIQRRMDDVDAGRVKTLPGDEVISRLRQRFGGR
jgi:putative addiction module component (TIGR02574 family)